MKVIAKRRRRENKTDYRLRLILLKSRRPRIVVRRTNKYFIAQVIESVEAKDKVVLGITSKDLLSNGWDKKFEGSLKSIPAGYLTGLLLAREIGKSKVKGSRFVLDLGLARTLRGNRNYAVVKGLIDGGLDLSANEEVFPSDERLAGEHAKKGLKEMVAKVKAKLGGKE